MSRSHSLVRIRLPLSAGMSRVVGRPSPKGGYYANTSVRQKSYDFGYIRQPTSQQKEVYVEDSRRNF